jgi:hypothetical protein
MLPGPAGRLGKEWWAGGCGAGCWVLVWALGGGPPAGGLRFLAAETT